MSTPAQYRSTFELFGDGQAVLNDLLDKFGGPLWSESADERTRRIGHREVLEHIAKMIDQANPPPV
jgi:hypothetical protein